MNTPIKKSAPRRALRHMLPDLLLLPTVALLLSAVMTWANVGFGDLFLARWARGFVISLIVLPVVLIFLGILEKRVDILFASLHKFGRTLLVSLLAAVMIESALALAVTLISNAGTPEFARHWWMAFSRSLPVGVMIGLFMGFYMKPRMDRMRAAKLAMEIR